MHIVNLMDAAKQKLFRHDPAFNTKAETVLAILRATGSVPANRASVNGALHKLLAAAITVAFEEGVTIDVPTRKLSAYHAAGLSTRLLGYLDVAVKEGLLLSREDRAIGALALGPVLIAYLEDASLVKA